MRIILRVVALVVAVISTDVSAGNSIALIGNNYRVKVFNEFVSKFQVKVSTTGNKRKAYVKETGNVVTTLLPGATNIQIANQLKNTNIAVVVVDSTIGPLPIDRDHIIIARQARVPVIAVLLANLTKLQKSAPKNAVELLELVGHEMRELLSSYEVGGDSTFIFYDRKHSYSGTPLSGMGIKETFNKLSKLRAARKNPMSTKRIKEFRGEFYLLSQLEANNKGIFLKKNKTITIWSEGTDSLSTVISGGNSKPGDVTNFSVIVNGNLAGNVGSRIILLNNGHLVGIGVIAKIHR